MASGYQFYSQENNLRSSFICLNIEKGNFLLRNDLDLNICSDRKYVIMKKKINQVHCNAAFGPKLSFNAVLNASISSKYLITGPHCNKSSVFQTMRMRHGFQSFRIRIGQKVH